MKRMRVRTIAITMALASSALLSACEKGSGEGGSAPAAVAASGNAEHGKTIFATTCSTCHAPDGTGIKGLGKDLVHSQWVHDEKDPALIAMITNGRGVSDPLNTTKVAMPAKGGNASLGDQDIADAVAYLRTINKP